MSRPWCFVVSVVAGAIVGPVVVQAIDRATEHGPVRVLYNANKWASDVFPGVNDAHVARACVLLWHTLPGVVIALAVITFLNRRRPSRPGCCRSCGYDLTGNESGTCPECGERA